MFSKIAYQCDEKQIYIGEVYSQESPLEPGVWLCPGGATFDAPPTIPEGKQAIYDFQNEEWSLVDIPKEETPKETPFSKLSADDKKQKVMQQVSILMSIVSTAYERMQWQDWNGTPVDTSLKTAWVNYRKALLAIPTTEQDQAYFIRLQSLESFAWPNQPAMPDDVA